MDSFIQRSSIVSKNASVSSDQPAATRIGINILERGGNAADAAIATWLAVSVLQPNTCCIGGDTQCLFYRNSDRTVMAVNGSGRTGEHATLEKLRAAGIENQPQNHGLWVSVPGAVAAMFDIHKNFGSEKKMDSFIQRSSIVSKNASVSSDQPAATRIGINILERGGNAADAAIATWLAVSVLQPNTCCIGGDTQCLFYRNSDKTVMAVNGSGKTGTHATLEKLRAAGIENQPQNHGLWVSVPGAVAAMFDIHNHFGSGKLTMEDILEPVIQLAEEGVPIPFKNALIWEQSQIIIKNSKNAEDLLIDGRAPKPGDIITAPKLAQCLRDIAKRGPEAFYRGSTAQHIINAVQEAGGVLTLDDLDSHLTDPPTPNPIDGIFVDFHGLRVWEMRPSTIGVVALVALNVLKEYDLKALGHNSGEYIHLLTETIKYAFLECWDNLCDPKFSTNPVEELLTEETAQKIRKKIDPERALESDACPPGGNTSYLAVVDGDGNGCSFINSCSSSFGSGIIPDECGFVLHNRGACMSPDEASPNALGPSKLPLHTIIPSLVTDVNSDQLLAVLGVMGRWMQPQGHVQVFLNMVVFGMDPQVALNQPRFFVGNPSTFTEYKDSLQTLCLEAGIDPSVVPFLENRGHRCQFLSGIKRVLFGKGHVIARPAVFNKDASANSETWWSGADPRSDGCAMGF